MMGSLKESTRKRFPDFDVSSLIPKPEIAGNLRFNLLPTMADESSTKDSKEYNTI